MVSVKIVMNMNRIAGREMGMMPKRRRSQRKGKRVAKKAKTPKIAREVPMGMAYVLFRYA